MNIVRYLIVDSQGRTRTTVNWPSLATGEWVFRLNITIPDAYDAYALAGDVELEVPEPTLPDLDSFLLGGAGLPHHSVAPEDTPEE